MRNIQGRGGGEKWERGREVGREGGRAEGKGSERANVLNQQEFPALGVCQSRSAATTGARKVAWQLLNGSGRAAARGAGRGESCL